MSVKLDALVAAVTKTQGIEASLVQAFNGLAQEIRNLPTTDPTTQAAIDDLASKVSAMGADMSNAVMANSDVAPTTTPAPDTTTTPAP